MIDLGITGSIDNPYVPDGLNQYDSVDGNVYTHDGNGNLSQAVYNSGTSSITTDYVYDVENRLVSVTGGNTATLRYDPLGRLYEVEDGLSNKRRMLYSGSDLIAEYNASGTMLNRYVHGLSAGDDPLIHYPGSGTATSNAQFLYADMRGSIVASFKADGSQVSLTPYDEYGVHGSASPGRFGYTGQVWVPEAGLYYYKARMYSPSLGRFMQTDPIGYADGLNMYRYAGNDPVNLIDPTGLNDEIPHICDTGNVCDQIVVPGSCGEGWTCIDGDDLWTFGNPFGVVDWINTSPTSWYGDIIVERTRTPENRRRAFDTRVRELYGCLPTPHVNADCPMNPGPPPEPIPNGCGGEGSIFNAGQLFKSCDVHDICYATLGATKAQCDRQFLVGMRQECMARQTQNVEASAMCFAIAEAFYTFVDQRGHRFYEAGQENARRRARFGR